VQNNDTDSVLPPESLVVFYLVQVFFVCESGVLYMYRERSTPPLPSSFEASVTSLPIAATTSQALCETIGHALTERKIGK
jgi:hypothetical protein